ncbi:hypothetical protein R6Z07F_014141 [Ovis aries]
MRNRGCLCLRGRSRGPVDPALREQFVRLNPELQMYKLWRPLGPVIRKGGPEWQRLMPPFYSSAFSTLHPSLEKEHKGGKNGHSFPHSLILAFPGFVSFLK